jgi:hypothetical protein
MHDTHDANDTNDMYNMHYMHELMWMIAYGPSVAENHDGRVLRESECTGAGRRLIQQVFSAFPIHLVLLPIVKPISVTRNTITTINCDYPLLLNIAHRPMIRLRRYFPTQRTRLGLDDCNRPVRILPQTVRRVERFCDEPAVLADLNEDAVGISVPVREGLMIRRRRVCSLGDVRIEKISRQRCEGG